MYKRGKIYKICNDVDSELYIGSTVKNLANRMSRHRSASKIQDSKVYLKMNKLGQNHFKIILLEEYSCETREQLRAREQYWIDLLKPALNSNVATMGPSVPAPCHVTSVPAPCYITCECGMKIRIENCKSHESQQSHKIKISNNL
ncbi:GIY-YIG nuclease family protein [Clostridium sp.]|uniref:GIY-YIG nuclease family protein n=1 Tax=Clostridium sp. TaxID=1506 RepID=UPI0037BF6545